MCGSAGALPHKWRSSELEPDAGVHHRWHPAVHRTDDLLAGDHLDRSRPARADDARQRRIGPIGHRAGARTTRSRPTVRPPVPSQDGRFARHRQREATVPRRSPVRQSTSGPVARLLPNLVAEARPSAQAGTVAAGAFSWTDTLAGARGANCCICSESAGSMPSVATCVPRRRWHPAMQHGLRCRFSSSAGRVCSGNGSGGDAASVRASPGR